LQAGYVSPLGVMFQEKVAPATLTPFYFHNVQHGSPSRFP
jgi:hypothetical protein